jgi:hypothetical protein
VALGVANSSEAASEAANRSDLLSRVTVPCMGLR